MAKGKAKRDGADQLINGFDLACQRLELINKALQRDITLEQNNWLVDAAVAIEGEWLLDPALRTPIEYVDEDEWDGPTED